MSRYKLNDVPILKSIILLVSGTGLAQLIPFVVSPILSRLYSPEDFGVFATFVSVAALFSVISSGRYELAIVLPRQALHAKQVVFLSIITLFSSVFLISVGLYFLNQFVELASIFFSLPVAVFAIGLINIIDKYNNRNGNYKLMISQRVAKAGIESALAICIAIIFDFNNGLIYSFTFSLFLVSVLLAYYIRKDFLKEKAHPLKCFAVAKKYSDFPYYSLPHGLLNTLSSNLPVYLIPIYYGSPVLGVYAFGLRMVQAPLGLFSASIYNVLNKSFADNYSQKKSLKKIFNKSLKTLIVCCIITTPIWLYIDVIFSIVFGLAWLEAGLYIQHLIPWILMMFISSPYSSIPQVFGKQKFALYIEVISFILKLAALVYFGNGYSIYTTLNMLATIGALTNLFSLVWYYLLVSIHDKQLINNTGDI
ncbi:O-antigen translocase [Psychromonas marina]|uniref:O-antigen translocase n=1 Tax=Psychromonas marina TaxID=88364 RepID=A0ABQ6DXP0_9GAMM|nr:oligosaccharide flippase family protein [Psychromonas marina]GLS89623.1 O-antigen translocase [Psychromonas marina]